jgi:outer membrane biosynthesis protein TonB
MRVALENKKGQRIASASAGAYVLLCILFLFTMKCEQNEDLSNMGIIVNLGTAETGMVADNVPSAEQVEEVEPVSEEVLEESASNEIEAITQDAEMVPIVATNKPTTEASNTNNNVTEAVKPVVKDPAPAVNENALFSGSNNANQGTGNTAGDQGNPNGNLESDIYGDIAGSGFGGAGDGASLKGRGVTFKPDFENPTNEFGKVVIKITVNKAGQVVKAELISLYSTNTNQALVQKAIQEAYKFKFNNVSSQHGSRDNQVGKIIYNFTAQ